MNATGCCVGLVAVLAIAPAVAAQTAPQAIVAPGTATAPPDDGAGLLWPQRTIQFNNAKPVLGLPLVGSKSMVRCGGGNTTFFNLVGDSQVADAAGVPRLYSISSEGEVKSLMRKLPLDFSDMSVLDFFPTETRVITLLRAVRRDDQGVHETRYFLSTLDTQGDFRDLVEIEGHFRPMKLAVFGSGDILLLGWDDANLLPVLALLKENGTIRYFLDVSDRRAKGAFDPGAVNAAMLEDAAFVAYGGNVLLFFPGTVKPVLELNATGVVSSIPIAIPAGYVLDEVLYSGSRPSIVIRVREKKDGEKPGTYDESKDLRRRLFEMSATSGSLLREFIPDKPKVSEVVCAGWSWTAVFYGTVVSSDNAASTAPGTQPAAAGGAQLVVSTVRR